MRLPARFPAIIAICWTLCPPLLAAPATDEALALLHRQDIAVEAVGYRLNAANAGWCRRAGYDPGFSIHTVEQYARDYRQTAMARFTLSDLPGVLAVAPGSPADVAGLRGGDAIEAADGKVMPHAGEITAKPDFRRTGYAESALATAFADGHADLAIIREGEPRTIAIDAIRACSTVYQVVTDGAINGAADGHYVQVSSDLVARAASRDELAAALAHELAHNILGHRARLDALSVDRGLLGQFGRSARLIRATEIEADRLSIYLLARAGYDSGAAIAFWQRVARATRSPLMFDRTHPGWRERLKLMQAERDRLAGGKDVGLPPDLAAKVAAARGQDAP